MSRLLLAMIYVPVGYIYMRLRLGKYHKHRLITDFNRRHYYAGMTIIWIPFLVFAILLMSWALINIIIYIVYEKFSSAS